MNEQPKTIAEIVAEISQLELADQPEAFAKLHDQLDAELNRGDTDSEPQ